MRPSTVVFRSSVPAVLLACVALAQTPAPTVVRWQRDGKDADAFLVQGEFVEALERGELIVSASLRDTGQKMQANVAVVNKTGHRIDVVPSAMTLEVTKPEQKSLAYQDPEKLAASIRHKGRWTDALVGGLAGAGGTTQTSETSGTVTMDDGSTGTVNATTTTRTHDQAAVDRAAAQVERKRRVRDAEASKLAATALLSNTLLPGGRIIGAVYFERTKHHDEAVLRVPVGDYVFEFPFRWEAKK